MKLKTKFPDNFLTPLLLIFFTVTVVSNLRTSIDLGGNAFSYLAQSFLEGKTYFLTKPDITWIDTISYGGKSFWPGGFFPAILLSPFVYVFNLFGIFFYQGFLQPFLVAIVFLLCFKISKAIGYSRNDSLFLGFAFCFSTVFLQVALWAQAWGFSQVTTTLLILLLIYGFLKKFPLLILGLTSGFALATRFSTIGSILFFILTILFNLKLPITKKVGQLLHLLVPFTFILILVLFYNFMRFGSFTEQGYTNQIVSNKDLEKARGYGLMSFIHVPGNLYYFLLSGLLPVFKDTVSHVLQFPFVKANPWGMSIFLTSPIFIYLFSLSYQDRLSKILIITIAAIAIPIFFYYGIGWRQFGYRYALDFLPFLFLLLIKNYKERFGKLSLGFKTVIVISSLTNFYLLITAFIYY